MSDPQRLAICLSIEATLHLLPLPQECLVQIRGRHSIPDPSALLHTKLGTLTAPQGSGSSPCHTWASSSGQVLVLWSCYPPEPQFPHLPNGDTNVQHCSLAGLSRDKVMSIPRHLRHHKVRFPFSDSPSLERAGWGLGRGDLLEATDEEAQQSPL